MSVPILPSLPFPPLAANILAAISCRILLAASLLLGIWPAAAAAQEAGMAVAVVQSATVTGASGEQRLEAGTPVSVGDLIKTGRGGQVQLVFSDDTKMVVGPNSSLVIETYLLRSGGTVNSFATRALGGTFRFITGKSPKEVYTVRTPAAAIGIRGTSFDLAVRTVSTDLLLFDGAVDLCGSGNCVLLEDPCKLGNAPRNRNVSQENSEARRNRQIRARFPYTVSQAPLLPEFRVATHSCGDLQRSEFRHEPPGPRERHEPRQRRQPRQDEEGSPDQVID